MFETDPLIHSVSSLVSGEHCNWLQGGLATIHLHEDLYDHYHFVAILQHILNNYKVSTMD